MTDFLFTPLESLSPGLAITLVLVLGAEFVNGWTDAPNAITTIVSTRSLSLRKSILLAVILNTMGAISGTEVAATIGKGIVNPEIINFQTVGAAMSAIIIWSIAAWKYGLPTSESHALVAGLIGAGLATAGPEVLLELGCLKVFIGLIFSTFFGLAGSYFLTKITGKISANFPPRATLRLFGRLQILSASFMAFSHGSNDGQKFIGAFTLALLLGGVIEKFFVPFWVIILCAIFMGIGTSFGGWRIIKTMGIKMVELETYQGFSAETSAAATIIFASHLGIPLSTTHTIGTSIMGSGLAARKNSLRWRVVKNIIIAWLLTFPICGIIAFAAVFLFQFIY